MDDAGEENPAAGERARGALGSCNSREDITIRGRRAKPRITVAWGEGDATTATFVGREAQTLGLLIKNGSRGFTSGEASPLGWARRTSHYVMRLRQGGVGIKTVREQAGDAMVGRYVLVSLLTVLDAGEVGR